MKIVIGLLAITAAVFGQDTKARFSGVGYVVAGSPTQCLGAVTYERIAAEPAGLLTPATTAKWVITVTGCYGQQEQARRLVNITASSLPAVQGGANYGTFDVRVSGWGLLTIIAADVSLRPRVGYTENRNQYFNLHEIDELTFQIIIEE